MVALPAASVCACPRVPFAVLTGATLTSEDDHVARFVTLAVLLSLYRAVATNETWVPSATLASIGVSEIELSVAALTVTPVEPVTPFSEAEIVALPTAIALTVPRMPAPGPPPPPVDTCAMPVLEDAHVACAVTSDCVLSL